jgi:hypothetical protein
LNWYRPCRHSWLHGTHVEGAHSARAVAQTRLTQAPVRRRAGPSGWPRSDSLSEGSAGAPRRPRLQPSFAEEGRRHRRKAASTPEEQTRGLAGLRGSPVASGARLVLPTNIRRPEGLVKWCAVEVAASHVLGALRTTGALGSTGNILPPSDRLRCCSRMAQCLFCGAHGGSRRTRGGGRRPTADALGVRPPITWRESASARAGRPSRCSRPGAVVVSRRSAPRGSPRAACSGQTSASSARARWRAPSPSTVTSTRISPRRCRLGPRRAVCCCSSVRMCHRRNRCR